MGLFEEPDNPSSTEESDLDAESHLSPLQVLFVPDSVFWITGTLARYLSLSKSWIVPTICSTPILSELLEADSGLLQRVDIVHLLDPWGSAKILPRISSSRPSVTTVYHVEDWDKLDHNTGADALMVIARQWEDFVLARGFPQSRLHRIPLGVDVDRFAPPLPRARAAVRRRLSIPASAFTIGIFAKLSRSTAGRKGIDFLLESLTGLQKEISDLAILIVGPGWADIVEQIRRLGIRCQWLPFVLDHQDLPPYYHALDLYWVTSRVEGGPATLLEAMACGLPCVSTPVGMAREVLTDGVNGFLTPMEDADALAEKTLALARDESLRARLGAAARSSTIAQHQWRDSARLLRQLYDTAIQRFERRTGSAPNLAADPLPPKFLSPPDRTPFPLNAVAPRWRRWVRMKEHLYWLRKSSLSNSPAVAWKVCFRAWRLNPLSVRPWIQLVRSWRM